MYIAKPYNTKDIKYINELDIIFKPNIQSLRQNNGLSCNELYFRNEEYIPTKTVKVPWFKRLLLPPSKKAALMWANQSPSKCKIPQFTSVNTYGSKGIKAED